MSQGMRKYFVASIKWTSFEDGGRKVIPKQGTRYCPLIRINDDGKNIDWSIDFVCPDFTQGSNIEFRFLVDKAPSDLIKKGIAMKYMKEIRRLLR